MDVQNDSGFSCVPVPADASRRRLDSVFVAQKALLEQQSRSHCTCCQPAHTQAKAACHGTVHCHAAASVLHPSTRSTHHVALRLQYSCTLCEFLWYGCGAVVVLRVVRSGSGRCK